MSAGDRFSSKEACTTKCQISINSSLASASLNAVGVFHHFQFVVLCNSTASCIIAVHSAEIFSSLSNSFVTTSFVSTYGPFVKKFEGKIKNYTKTKNVVALINGTAALQLALKSLDLKKNDEILIPSLNFIASTNATIYNNLTPHFIETEKDTLGIDVEKLDKYLEKI